MKIVVTKCENEDIQYFECDWVFGLGEEDKFDIPYVFEESGLEAVPYRAHWGTYFFKGVRLLSASKLIPAVPEELPDDAYLKENIEIRFYVGPDNRSFCGIAARPVQDIRLDRTEPYLIAHLDVYNKFDALAFLIVDAYANGQYLDWRTFTGKRQKESWITATSKINNWKLIDLAPESNQVILDPDALLPNLSSLEIDCNDFTTEVDLYIALAEQVYGPYGYLGTCGVAFGECMSELRQLLYQQGKLQDRVKLKLTNASNYIENILSSEGIEWEWIERQLRLTFSLELQR